jgi:hypothetical protein
MLINLLLQIETGEILVNDRRVNWTVDERTLLQNVLAEPPSPLNRSFSLIPLAKVMTKKGESLNAGVDRFHLTRNSISTKIREVVGDQVRGIPHNFNFLTIRAGGSYYLHNLIQISHQ